MPQIQIKPEKEGLTASLTVNYYDSENNLIHTYTGAGTGEKTEYETVCLYHQSPASAVCMEVIIEKTENGILYADDFQTNDGTVPFHAPECDVDNYMIPMWKTDKTKETTMQYAETVLLYSEGGAAASGELLHLPSGPLTVTDYSTHRTFTEGVDYVVCGNKITRLENSEIPYKCDKDFKDTLYDYYEIPGAHIAVTYPYSSKEVWEGPEVGYKGDMLPNMINKLRNKQPVTVVVYGDSITRGLCTSANEKTAPYMPTWVELFVRGLKKQYGYEEISLVNAGTPGEKCGWGAESTHLYVTRLRMM